MGRYDDIDPEALRTHLVRLARLILRLDRDDALLREAPRLQKVLGDLRQRLFAYEVRGTSRLDAGEEAEADGDEAAGPDDPDALIDESLRIVREAMERTEELREELEGSPPDQDEDEDP